MGLTFPSPFLSPLPERPELSDEQQSQLVEKMIKRLVMKGIPRWEIGGQCACSRSISNPVGNVQEKCFFKCSKVCDFQMPALTDLCAHLQDLFGRFNRRVFSRIRGLSA